MSEEQKVRLIIELVVALVPVLVSLVGVIPTIIANRKKTETKIEEFQEKTEKSLKEMKEQIKNDSTETNRKVDVVSKKLDAHIKENEEDNAKQLRARILNFYDELCEEKRHSESHFEDILDDIDSYEDYTDSHRDFKNSRGKAAMEYIKDTYHRIKEKGGFLVHKET